MKYLLFVIFTIIILISCSTMDETTKTDIRDISEFINDSIFNKNQIIVAKFDDYIIYAEKQPFIVYFKNHRNRIINPDKIKSFEKILNEIEKPQDSIADITKFYNEFQVPPIFWEFDNFLADIIENKKVRIINNDKNEFCKSVTIEYWWWYGGSLAAAKGRRFYINDELILDVTDAMS